MLVIRARIHKMLVRIAHREDTERSDLGLHCLSRPFWWATNVRNFRALAYNTFIQQGSYMCQSLKNSRAFKRLYYCLQGLKLMKIKGLHSKIKLHILTHISNTKSD